MPADKTLADLKRNFDIPVAEMKRIMRDFRLEMEQGLSGRTSSLKMIPAYVARPRGTEKGKFLALDLGGTNFRTLALELNGRRKARVLAVKKFALEQAHMTGSGDALFDFIARCIKIFVREVEIREKKVYHIGFTFSFPIKQTGISRGILLRWTKGFCARGVEKKDVVKLLNNALKRIGLRNAKVTAITNDTVSTLIAKSYEDADCDMGVILGTGTNACYCEKISNITKMKAVQTNMNEMIVNIEWGNFNKLRFLSCDKKLDMNSNNPGQQRLEKMVSGMYLGELARLVVVDLAKRGIIFKQCNPGIFSESAIMKTEHMSTIQGDTSKKSARISALLNQWGIFNTTPTDRRTLRYVCSMVSSRAARVSAGALAAVILKMDSSLSKKHTVAIDGTVYERYPGFAKLIKSALKEIFKEKARNIRISLTKDGSGKGAAILAAT